MLNGITPYKYQEEDVRRIEHFGGRVLNANEMGCVSCDTEYLSPRGWARIDQYDGGLVTQYDPFTGVAEYVKPEQYIVLPCTEMIHFKHTRGMDQLVSEDHRMLSVNSDGNIVVFSASQLASGVKGTGQSRFPSAFTLKDSNQGLLLTEAQLRVQVALMADGYFAPSLPQENKTVVIRLKKERKIARLRMLLAAAEIEYSEKPCLPKGFQRFRFVAPVKSKTWDTTLYGRMTIAQRCVICEECLLWDGSEGNGNRGGTFFTSVKKNADFIQFCFASTGQRAAILTYDRRGESHSSGYIRKSIEYVVSVTGTGRSGIHINFAVKKNPQNAKRVLAPDGKKYCFTVPSSFLVLRRNNQIFCTGNCGKTLETLWALKRNPTWLPALLVVPATVKLNWKYEASHFFGMSASVCESRTPPKHNNFNFSTHTPLTIINYDILKDWLPYLKQQGFKTLVCDEIQACQSPKTHRTKAVQQVATWVEHVMMLSGTPLSNRPIELFPILNMLWPKAFPSFATYAQSYCRPRYTPWGWKYDGAENLDQLHAILRGLGMIRRRKADVLQDLPPKVRRIIPCELSNPQEYYDANENFILWLKKNAAHRVQSAMRAQSLVKLGMLLQISARLKIKTPIDWANRFLEETDEKLVMFACHEKAIDALKRRIEAKSVVLDGTVGHRERQLAVDQFQHDDSVRVFIGSRAAWSGITLTAASNIGMVELFWRPGDVLQAESRIDRIGQKAVSTIWYFIAQGTIEERLCTILQEKQEVISAVLDGGKNPGDLNIFSLLLDEIEQTL